MQKKSPRGLLARTRAVLLAAACLGSYAAAASRQNPTQWTLDDLVKQLDSEARGFRSLSADIDRTKVTVVVNDKATETGQILVRQYD